MTAAPDSPRLVVPGPDCLPALVPHLLGFRPESSLVVLGLDPGSRRVRITLRLDLGPDADRAGIDPDMAVPLLRAGATAAVLLVYPARPDDPWAGPRPGALPHRGLVDAVGAAVETAGVQALDALCVVGDRLGSYWCADPRCCPPEGRLVPASQALAVDAAMAVHGSAPLESRAALEAVLAPRDDGDPLRAAFVDELDLRLADAPLGVPEVDELLLGLALWVRADQPGHLLAPLAALAAALCGRIRSRDLLLRALTVDAEPETVSAARSVLVEAVRCLPEGERAPSASVLAVCAWISGDGASARVALDRAAAADPAYSLAALVEAALDAGTPPWTWQAMMADLTVEAILAASPDPAAAPDLGEGWDGEPWDDDSWDALDDDGDGYEELDDEDEGSEVDDGASATAVDLRDGRAPGAGWPAPRRRE